MCRAPAEYRRSVQVADPPSATPDPNLRVSDAERERVAERLRTHAADGRLAVEELEERLAGAFSARTRADLEPLLADLPGSPEGSHARERGRGTVPPAVWVGVLLVAIWALTGMGYFWPMWPMIGLFFGARAGYRRRRRAISPPQGPSPVA